MPRPSIWQDVLEGCVSKASANFYASPLVTGDMLYAIREDGVVFVARVEGNL
jgi:hypothetical protein